MRNAVVLAKELATLDALIGGRVVAGVGVGWNAVEFANVGEAERFHRRGAYLDETIRLWRHLWSGSTEPFEGRFHRFSDFTFGPLPAQGAALPIVIGGRSDAAIRRAARWATGSMRARCRRRARGADGGTARMRSRPPGGRPIPSRRGWASGSASGPPSGYGIAGSRTRCWSRCARIEDSGVDELAFSFGETDAERAPGRHRAIRPRRAAGAAVSRPIAAGRR